MGVFDFGYPRIKPHGASGICVERVSSGGQRRPVAELAEAPSDVDPRRPAHGWRCAPRGRPTLSCQYKDLLMDFEVRASAAVGRGGAGLRANPLVGS